MNFQINPCSGIGDFFDRILVVTTNDLKWQSSVKQKVDIRQLSELLHAYNICPIYINIYNNADGAEVFI
jgi:hypothetical protein